MRALEDSYWWYQALRRSVTRHLRKALGTSQTARCVLDAGCGTGGTLATLRQQFPEVELIGLDLHPEAVGATLERGITPAVLLGSVNQLPFHDGFFDAVILLDVLYHARVDEDAALAEVRRVLKPGGPLLLNVAAFDALRGPHDAAVHGTRRYNPARVRSLARRHAMDVDFLTCWNMVLSPAIWARRRIGLAASSEKSDLQPTAGCVNAVLRILADMEWHVSQRLPLPFGSSIFAVLRRRVDS
jgi:SAM-dependent methyltransferase